MSYKYIFKDEIDSTSSYLKRNFDILDDFTIVETNYQSLGHGRFSRKWISNKGENLLFSLLIKNKNIIQYMNKLSVFCSYILMESLLKFYPELDINFKWPNDVYVGNKKVSGILLETHMSNNEIDGIIIGIGINLNQTEFDEEIKNKASSIRLLINKEVDKNTFSKYFFDLLTNQLLLIDEKYDKFIKFIKNHNFLKDKEVKYLLNNEEKLIKIVDINDDCSLKAIFNNEEIDIISGELII